jgi:uncharacterized membrane protein (UPF0127 family)
MKFLLHAALAGLLFGTPAFAQSAEIAQENAALGPLAVQTRQGVKTLQVELAATPQQQERGLMFRRDMPADQGMLFVFGRPRFISMWMENTYLPLDMLFIDANARVAKIVENTKPLSRETISSGGDVVAVLELNAGAANRLGIHVHDTVSHPALSGR